jgi:hypothetical protein
MDAHFQNVMFDVINQFLDRLSERVLLPKEKLWTTWKDMFNFPNPEAAAVKKGKRVTKDTKDAKEVKDVKKETTPKKATSTATAMTPVVTAASVTTVPSSASSAPPSVENTVEYRMEEKVELSDIQQETISNVATVETVANVSSDVTTLAPSVVSTVSEIASVATQPKKEKTPDKESGCKFVITRGERAGKNCAKPICKKSDTFCTTHCK